ncbi:hypothetical protein EVAR_37924_1 [Eumeta japonica]|uniref:Uncharacterized protein n=1 Tax=Eumeta variegata TaxID=151549 RepID=A0A4C1XDX7_EUMVA|nr:hypothetical protein EVAR_37924_1 [Eumeta japonica]
MVSGGIEWKGTECKLDQTEIEWISKSRVGSGLESTEGPGAKPRTVPGPESTVETRLQFTARSLHIKDERTHFMFTFASFSAVIRGYVRRESGQWPTCDLAAQLRRAPINLRRCPPARPPPPAAAQQPDKETH